MATQAASGDDYDTPWKDALTRYFPEFMAFYFPLAHAENWDKQRIIDLFGVIDWLMRLPNELGKHRISNHPATRQRFHLTRERGS